MSPTESQESQVESYDSPNESVQLQDLLRYLDRDGDGLISRYEGAEAFLLLVEEADADADGALGAEEVVSFLDGVREEEREEREEMFQEFDADENGRLSAEELPEEVRGLLGDVDQDDDEEISLSELLAADELGDPADLFEQEVWGFLEEVDHDGDGAFALKDLPDDMREDFELQFEDLDEDRDGLITSAELQRLIERENKVAEFEVAGSVAVMSGVIGPSTPAKVLELILEHPEVETIHMQAVPGSMDDVANLRAADLVRRARLHTHVPAGGEVASGGTDFFLAGMQRSAGKGARFGVHSWAGFDEEGVDLPRSHPEHRKYLDYYRDMGIPESFYWFTLEAAPAAGIHWMTKDELDRYGMLTMNAPAHAARPKKR